ncbi:GntR family transcriptional regulator [Pseudonocardia sp. ICBG1293]|uniref:GntR family transcriptional regulator n=1 Tax=Pseudonocardia sp. ICBG1293 TaxID=2844382 RepID=UPI001CD00320|nr:GntR family transcriptional regulator [Pseudonocardia sp. ICBG1293]
MSSPEAWGGDLAAHPGLGAAATDRVRGLILSGELRDGDRLVERDLAERLGISRGPVRDALRRLDAEGLVVLLPRRGARVATLTADDTEEIIALRAATEPLAVRALATARSTQHARELGRIVEELQAACAARDNAAAVSLDFALHRRIHELCGRRRLLHTWETISAPLHHVFRLSRDLYDDLGDIADSHRTLLDDITSGDPARAEAAARAHVTRFGPELLRRIPREEGNR